MKQFTDKNGSGFGFVISTFTVDGIEWANVIRFTSASKRKATMKVSDIVIEE